MQVMQMEYRIQKDSIVAEIIKRTGSNQNDHVPSGENSFKLTFCGACIWITKLVHIVHIFEFLQTRGA